MELPSPEAVQKEFITILQQLVFLFADPLPTSEESEEQISWRGMQMEFSGPFAGGIMLHLPQPLQQEVAANFLGLDAEDDEISKSAEDAVGELLNVVCGHILSQWAGEDAAFDLARPVPTQQPPPTISTPTSMVMAFDIEGSPAKLTLSLRESNTH